MVCFIHILFFKMSETLLEQMNRWSKPWPHLGISASLIIMECSVLAQLLFQLTRLEGKVKVSWEKNKYLFVYMERWVFKIFFFVFIGPHSLIKGFRGEMEPPTPKDKHRFTIRYK